MKKIEGELSKLTKVKVNIPGESYFTMNLKTVSGKVNMPGKSHIIEELNI